MHVSSIKVVNKLTNQADHFVVSKHDSLDAALEAARASVREVWPDAVFVEGNHGNEAAYQDEEIADDGGEPCAELRRLYSEE